MRFLLLAVLVAISYAQTAEVDGTTMVPGDTTQEGTGEAADTTNIPDDGVVCPGYSFDDDTQCDCDSDCVDNADTNCGCAEAQECCAENSGVVCPGYSFDDDTQCDCDSDCVDNADTYCGCAEAQACCNGDPDASTNAPATNAPATNEPATTQAVITQKLTAVVTFNGVDNCAAALPSIKEALANVNNLPEAQITVTAGAGCDASGAKQFNVEMQGSDAQINAVETTVKAADFKQKLDLALAAIITESGEGDAHPMSGAAAAMVSAPVKTPVTSTTKSPEEDSSGISTGIIIIIVVVVLIVIGGAVFFMMSQAGGVNDEDVEMAEKTTYE